MLLSVALLAAMGVGMAQAFTMVNSGYIMRKNIDSIIQPGEYTSHMHSFFGNDAVNVNTSTTKELVSGCSTNSNPNDLSVYWHPTLYVNDGTGLVPVEARYFKAYYESINTAEIPFPEDFKAVAGNAKATTKDDIDELWSMSWWCEYGPATTPAANGWPSTGCNLGRLQTQLRFPDCVNPNTLESDYSSRAWLVNANRCPTGMKRIPQLRFSVRFDVSGVIPGGWSGEAPFQLSSGNAYSWHGDFINGWLPKAAENMMLATDKKQFQVVNGPNTEPPACQPVDADPDNGTSDYDESLLLRAAASGDLVADQSAADTGLSGSPRPTREAATSSTWSVSGSTLNSVPASISISAPSSVVPVEPSTSTYESQPTPTKTAIPTTMTCRTRLHHGHHGKHLHATRR